MDAALAKANDWATLVGSNTGGSAEGPVASTTLFLTLPNSGIHLKIPAIFNKNAIHGPPTGLGTVPHIRVETSIHDLVWELDPVREYVRKLILGRSFE